MKTFLRVIIFLLVSSAAFASEVSQSENRVLVANTLVDCNNNRLSKGAECELVLNYDYTNFDIYLIKLYKRGAEGADINDLSRNPASYKNNNMFIDYKNQLELVDREKVTTVSGNFVRDKNDPKSLKIRLRVGISKFRDATASDFSSSAGAEDEEADEDYRPPTEVVTSKRTKEIEMAVNQ